MARHLPAARARTDTHVRGLADLGLAVRDARAEARLRIDDAAAFIGVSADLLSRLENGKPVTTDKLLKVFEGLGLELLVVPRSHTMKLRDALKETE
jgi:transcriptional regulator with XRE-family HTH domain